MGFAGIAASERPRSILSLDPLRRKIESCSPALSLPWTRPSQSRPKENRQAVPVDYVGRDCVIWTSRASEMRGNQVLRFSVDQGSLTLRSQSDAITGAAVNGPSKVLCSSNSSSSPIAFVLPSSSGLGRRRVPDAPRGRSRPPVRSPPGPFDAKSDTGNELALELDSADTWCPRSSLTGGPLRPSESLCRYGNPDGASSAEEASCWDSSSRACACTN
jgi:hypothetical protein